VSKRLKEIEIVEDITAISRCDEGFLKLRRLMIKHHYTDGTESRVYPCDIVEPPSNDAVVVVLYFFDKKGDIYVGLRRGIRPAIYFRKNNPSKFSRDGKVYLDLLEVVAGGIESSDIELGEEGIKNRVIKEVEEEAGFRCSAENVIPLGGGCFSSPGITPEKFLFFAIRVDPNLQHKPSGDGHPMEDASEFQFLSLKKAITMCYNGEIEDAKTEIALRRLAEKGSDLLL
jgi:ADP-ribose pyrophosphatase